MGGSRDDDEARLEAILEAWFAARHAGSTPSLADLCAGAPHLQPRVRQVLDRHAALLGDEGGGAAPPAVIDALGDFRLKARIGRGGMGDVYLARQESLGRLVALKVLPSHMAGDPTRRIRFRREAEITAALDHPNIVPIYQVGETDGHSFIAMKLLDGATLDAIDPPLAPIALARVGARIARALHAAHEVGVVHRDVKPANVLLEGDRPYLLDFGLARGRVDLSLTRDGQSPGTLAFMAPEQLQGGPAALDPRVDVYGLGATLYACLAGAPPFADDRAEVLVRRILTHEPPPLGDRAGHRDLDTIVRRAMAKEPSGRFPSALALAEDLERFAGGYPIVSRRPGLVQRAGKLMARNRGISVAIAAAFAVAAALGLLLWQRDSSAQADRGRRLARAREDVAEGRLAGAYQRLLELRETLRGDAEVDDLAARTLTALQREALLDELQADRRYQEAAHLATLEARVVAGHPDVVAEPKTALAVALVALFDGRAGAAVAALDAGGAGAHYPRTRAAIAAVAGGADAARALATAASPAGPHAADDHVFASVVLRGADQPLSTIAAELARARAAAPEQRRVVFGTALLETIAGHVAIAEAMLRGLLRDRVPSPEVHVMLARLLTRRHEFADAERHLAQAHADLASSRRPPRLLRLDLAELDLCLESDRLAEFDQRLAAAREHWGPSALLCLKEADAAELRAEPDRARDLLRRGLELATRDWNRRRIRAALLGNEVRRLLAADPPAADVAAAVDAAEQLRTDAAAAHDADSGAEACAKLAFLRWLQRDADAARDACADALGLDADNADANYWAVRFAYEDLSLLSAELAQRPADASADAALLRRAHRAIAAAREALDRAARLTAADGRLALPARCETAVYETAIALLLGDRGRARQAGARAHRWVAADTQLGVRQVLDWCRAELGVDDWDHVR